MKLCILSSFIWFSLISRAPAKALENPLNPRGASQLETNYMSPLGVRLSNPSMSYDVTGPYSLLSIAGPTLYIAGVRGIHPSNSTLAEVGHPRIQLAFENMAFLARSAGSELTSCVRLVVYVSDMYRYRPIVNAVQHELWGKLNATGKVLFPPRTIIEAQRLNDDDIVEVEGTFWLGD